MIHKIECKCLPNSKGEVHVIETREQALVYEQFFFQLTNLCAHRGRRAPVKDLLGLVNSHTHFVFITETTNLIASATLIRVNTALQRKGFLEDPVVDEQYRRSGLGRVLVEEVMKLAQRRGCQYLDAISHEDDVTHCFYPRLGFDLVAMPRELGPTNPHLYRYQFPKH